ncbi:coiled-coil domain-containing protein 175 isoform X2 [Hyperolius riggenbachi]|uniref:coiled-coil domain-containing protein 175 isoform X2 n=1 Tax=Hyperolius riggenbachi TaxID=752182 RepID=UPI0035A31E16
MAAPDSAAVSVVLEHFMEVEKHLKEQDPAFDEEAFQHLVAVADAVKELEDIRRATRELLEIETIENSKLRYQIIHLPRIITEEIEAAVARARESVTSEKRQLQEELRNIILELDNTEKKQLTFEEMHSSLGQQGRSMWDKHQEAVDLLNQQMADKAHQSILVNQTHNRRKEAEDAVIEYQHKTEDLAEDMVTERKQFTAERENLIAEILETKQKTEAQEARNAEKAAVLSQRMSALFDVEEKITRENEIVSALKNKILLLQASHGSLTNKLDLQNKQCTDLSNKIDILELRMVNQKEDFIKQSDSLKEKISKLDEDMKAAEMQQETEAERHKTLKQQYQNASEEEDRQHAMKKDTTLQLDKSRALLSEKQEVLGKTRKELTEMEQDYENLLESMRLSTEHLATQVEESKENLLNERQKRMTIQIRKDEVTKEIELWKLSEETIIKELKQRIVTGQKKQIYLTQEGKRLQEEIKKWDKEIHTVTQDLAKASRDYLNEEQKLKEQIKTLEETMKSSMQHLESEKEKLSIEVPIMNEAEETHNKENSNYEELKKHVGELRSKQKSLEKSINNISKEIEASSKKKEAEKISLKALRSSALKKLQSDLSIIKALDKDSYEINRKLELVIMENCRLKLHNAQYKDDIKAIKSDSERHILATRRLEKDLTCLIEHLHKGWEEDNFACSDFSERDQEILDSIVELLKKINQREEKVGHLNHILKEKFTGLAFLLQDSKGKKGVH